MHDIAPRKKSISPKKVERGSVMPVRKRLPFAGGEIAVVEKRH